MISQTQLDYFKEAGIWYTGIPALSSKIHLTCMQAFLSRSEEYKAKFLQTRFNARFEGYSFMGQEDSANQYADDQLYTYVMSDYFDSKLHPDEFQLLFEEQEQLIPKIAAIERQLLSQLLPELLDFFDRHIAHSLSANFYPSG